MTLNHDIQYHLVIDNNCVGYKPRPWHEFDHVDALFDLEYDHDTLLGQRQQLYE